MRITTRLATAGSAGFMSMPVLPRPAESYVNDEVGVDEAAIRRDMADTPGVQFSSDDRGDTLAFTVELLDRMKSLMNGKIAADCGVSKAGGDGRKSAAEHRFARGKFAFVRVDVGRVRGGLRARISTANPRNAVGQTEQFAGIYAQAFADNLVDMAESLATHGVHVEVVEGDGCTGVVAEAKARLAAAATMARHAECPGHRHETPNGLMCAPCVFSCELYRDGRCTYKKPNAARKE